MIITEILRKYGLKTLFYPLVIGMIVWILGHFFSAPGKQVSILWGMVEYTKWNYEKIQTKQKIYITGNSTKSKTDGNNEYLSLKKKYDDLIQEYENLITEINESDCPNTLAFKRKINVLFAEGYINTAEKVKFKLVNAGAIVELIEVNKADIDENPRKKENFGIMYYRDSKLSSQAIKLQKLLKQEYDLKLKEGRWIFTDTDFTIWIGPY